MIFSSFKVLPQKKKVALKKAVSFEIDDLYVVKTVCVFVCIAVCA